VVTCTATDVAGNSATCSFAVTVEDTTAPTLGAITARQGATDVKDCAAPALQGTVQLTVQASDECGLAAVPAVDLVNGPHMERPTFVQENPPGTFRYTWEVLDTTAQGDWTATVTATDGGGNATTSSFRLCVNKLQVTGHVQSEGFVGGTRDAVFVATDARGTVLATWTRTLIYTGDTGFYTLTDVPENTAGLSVKTAWTLRSKQAVVFNPNGQAENDFTGADQMLGGDLDGDNEASLPDYALMADHFFTNDAATDINGDGVVNVADYSILASHWYTVGDPE
jgi:hypothetical protein